MTGMTPATPGQRFTVNSNGVFSAPVVGPAGKIGATLAPGASARAGGLASRAVVNGQPTEMNPLGIAPLLADQLQEFSITNSIRVYLAEGGARPGSLSAPTNAVVVDLDSTDSATITYDAPSNSFVASS